MVPLVGQLATRFDNESATPGGAEPGPVELISSRNCLPMDLGKIPVKADNRCGARAETIQLRVMPVTTSLAAQNGPCEQRFTPERHQSPGIEISGVQGPESHREKKPLPDAKSPTRYAPCRARRLSGSRLSGSNSHGLRHRTARTSGSTS